MLLYQVTQFDSHGNMLRQAPVQAASYHGALKELRDVEPGCQKIVVHSTDGEKAGEVGAEYWRQRLRRGR